jgi:hypothetical protein
MSEIETMAQPDSAFHNRMRDGHANRQGHTLQLTLWRVIHTNGDVDAWQYSRACCGDTVPTIAELGLGRTPNYQDTLNAVAFSISQILNDIQSGRVPNTVASFSELHDYVDANEYGNLCDESSGIDWLSSDYAEAVQNAVNIWIQLGGAK